MPMTAKNTWNSAAPATSAGNRGAELRMALAITFLWVSSLGLLIMLLPGTLPGLLSDATGLLLAAIAAGLPIVLIWSTAIVVRSLRSLRSETSALHQSIEDMRQSVAGLAAENSTDRDGWVESQLVEIASLTQQTDSRISELTAKTFEAHGETPPPRNTAALSGFTAPPADSNQADLPLETPATVPREPITVKEFIRALNFPENAEDKEGFRVLRRAFEERELGKLLQASQDVLTLLSQDGIYMDDLNPDVPLPGIWRKFARGERGLNIAALGGIRDRSALALTRARMKNDTVFRDTTHHFLRQMDMLLTEFEKSAEDSELTEMSQTRSGRAFMLLGRVAGAFD
jgi:hypothetical protein